MDLLQLHYFRTVASLEHMTKAAEVLYVSQPSLSRTISNLEKELGTELFYRTGRKITLNSYGKIFLKHVDKALEELKLGKEEVAEALSGVNRPIVVSSVLTGLITDLTESYVQQHPDVQVTFRIDSSDTFQQLLQDGSVDFIISDLPVLPFPTTDWTVVTREQFYVLMSREHPLAKSKTLSLEQIRNERFALPEKSAPIRTILDHFLKTRGITLQVGYEINDVYVQLHLIERNSAICLIPRSALFDMVRSRGNTGYHTIDQVVAIPLSNENMEWDIAISPLTEQNHSARTQEFRRCCIDIFQQRDKAIEQVLTRYCSRFS